jgi:hypothetical protein
MRLFFGTTRAVDLKLTPNHKSLLAFIRDDFPDFINGLYYALLEWAFPFMLIQIVYNQVTDS